MNCASVKAWMRERFDQGLALEEGFEAHLGDCVMCRAYLARLRALESGLADLPVEAPSPHFKTALVARVQRQRQATSRTWAGALAAVTAFAFLALGWQLPIVSYLRGWFVQLAAWPPDISVSQSLLTPFLDLGREAWSAIELPGFVPSVGSPWISGGSIAVLLMILVGFNALLVKSGGEPGSGPFRRT